MYFKRLEVFGFKSFAGKTKLKFEVRMSRTIAQTMEHIQRKAELFLSIRLRANSQ